MGNRDKTGLKLKENKNILLKVRMLFAKSRVLLRWRET